MTILQLCRATIDGGYDYHREISRAFSEHRVLSVFARNGFGDERSAAYHGEVLFLHAERHRLLRRPWFAARRLCRLSAGRSFELLICHHHAAALIGARLRRRQRHGRLAYVVHDFGYFDAHDRHGRRRRRFVRRELAPDDCLVAVSHALREDILAALPQLAPAQCRVVHNALDVDGFLPACLPRAEARRALGLPPQALVFGCVGRLVPYKAQRDLIEAFAGVAERLPEARLAIIGRGGEHARLAAQIRERALGDRAALLGFVPQASRLMAAFDVFVLPSRREPFGLVLLEAMAQSLPVIAAKAGAAPEILADSGRLYPSGDSTALGHCLLELGQRPELRRTLGEAAQRRLRERFDIDAYRAGYRALSEGLGA